MIYLQKFRSAFAVVISSIVISSMAYADDVITFAEADTITGESLIASGRVPKITTIFFFMKISPLFANLVFHQQKFETKSPHIKVQI